MPGGARDRWRAWAASAGLSFRAASRPGQIGEANGIRQGHRVLVRPDRPALFVEYRFTVAGLRLSTGQPARGRPPLPLPEDAAFVAAFPARCAPEPAAGALRAAGDFRALAVAVAQGRAGVPRSALAGLAFEEAQAVLHLRRPGRLRHALGLAAPFGPAMADAALSALLAAVTALEAALRTHALRVAAGGTASGRTARRGAPLGP